jgi:hypothetical protein
MAKGLRGTCDGMPLELTGEFTGYNNGATMQVGLWITNDGEHIELARQAAFDGPASLREVLTNLLQGSQEPRIVLTFYAAMNASGGFDSIDWAQLTYSLVFVEPSDEDLAAERSWLQADEAEIWKSAYARNHCNAEEIAMLGVDR